MSLESSSYCSLALQVSVFDVCTHVQYRTFEGPSVWSDTYLQSIGFLLLYFVGGDGDRMGWFRPSPSFRFFEIMFTSMFMSRPPGIV